MTTTRNIPIIIDTDIGDDIDDAFALCIAMQAAREGRINILGVTTVFRDTIRRAKIAGKLLELGGFGNVGVYHGAATPLHNAAVFGKPINVEQTPVCYDEETFGSVPVCEMNACDFIIKTLEEASEPVTIVCMGALTNIADVMRFRPDLESKIAMLSIMGGSFTENMCEYNFACDPEAADIVLSSSVSKKCLGVDITFKCPLHEKNVAELEKMKSPCINLLMNMRKKWTGGTFLHDPLALMTAFNPDFAVLAPAAYKVNCGEGVSRGMCIRMSDHNWHVDASSQAMEVAVGVHADEFEEECMRFLRKYDEQI